jgi:hypothetical protein
MKKSDITATRQTERVTRISGKTRDTRKREKERKTVVEDEF